MSERKKYFIIIYTNILIFTRIDVTTVLKFVLTLWKQGKLK